MATKPRPDGLPPGWKEYTTATGATYFYNELSGKTAWEYPTADTPEGATSASSGPPPFLTSASRDSSRSDLGEIDQRVSDSSPAENERRGSFFMKVFSKKNKTPKFEDKSPRVDAPEPRSRLTSYDSAMPSSLKNSKSYGAIPMSHKGATAPATLAEVMKNLEADDPPETPHKLRHRSASFDPSSLPAGLSPPPSARASESAVSRSPKNKHKGFSPRNAPIKVNTSRRKSNPDNTPPPLPPPPGSRRPASPKQLADTAPRRDSNGTIESTPEKAPPPVPPKSPVAGYVTEDEIEELAKELPVPDKKPPAAPSLFRLFGSASRQSVSDDENNIIKPAHPNIHYVRGMDDEAVADVITIDSRLDTMDWNDRVRCIVDVGLALHFLHILPHPLFVPGLCPERIALSDTGAFQVVVDQRVFKTSPDAALTGAMVGNVHTCQGAGYLHQSDLHDLALLPVHRRQYVAPEVFRGSMTDTSDVWALGIVAAQLLTGLEPFDPSHNPSSIVDRVIPIALELDGEDDEDCPHRASVIYTECEEQGWPEHVVTAMLRLIAACCRPAASDRVTSSELLQRVAAVEQALDK